MPARHIHGISMQRAAEILGTTRPHLFRFLREHRLLGAHNVPTTLAARMGVLTLDTRAYHNRVTGISRQYATPLVTGPGLIWLQEQLGQPASHPRTEHS